MAIDWISKIMSWLWIGEPWYNWYTLGSRKPLWDMGSQSGLFHCSWQRSPRGDSTIIYNPPIFGSMEAFWSIQNLKRFRIIQCLLIKPTNVCWLIHPLLVLIHSTFCHLPVGCHRIGSCCTPAVAEATSGPKSCGIVELICWHIKTPIGRWPLNISGLRYR